MQSKSRAPVVALFYPFDGERRSILLQRGKVRVKQISLMKASVWSETADDRELILLTQAFLVADRTTARGTNNLLNAAAKVMQVVSYENCSIGQSHIEDQLMSSYLSLLFTVDEKQCRGLCVLEGHISCH